MIKVEEKRQSSESGNTVLNECGYHETEKIMLVRRISRLVFLLAVLGSGILAVALFLYGFLVTIGSLVYAVTHFSMELEAMKEVMAMSIEIIDLFLVATVFYIISLGFYELFISKAPLPGWLKICDLDDLKDKLLGLVVIALAVLFLGEALTWTGAADILGYGLGTAATIIAISLYFWAKH